MKKHTRYYFKPWVQKTLELISITLFVLLMSIDDFELWTGLFVILGMLGVLMVNISLLKRFGRYNDLENN